MSLTFETEYAEILKKLDQIDPIQYGRTRNYIDGAVTYLSPYISRGVISTRMVLDHLIHKGYTFHQAETLIKELCWRDYFQRVAQHKVLEYPIKQEQEGVLHHQVPTAIMEATNGIDAIDDAIRDLYETGYMHNHCRMYTAFIICNLARAHWLMPARWMYYHLLDGDWASNAGSWQWVAGANSHKKYYANQENINKYTGSNQRGTYIDQSYEAISLADVPEELIATTSLSLATQLPDSNIQEYHPEWPTFVYNYYNLDPSWHANEMGNRILLLDPAFFQRYPVSDSCIQFCLKLAKNISNIQLFNGSFEELVRQYPSAAFHYKEHPLNHGYVGCEETRDWIAPEVVGYYPSFFAYWKKAERYIRLLFTK